MFDTLPRVCRSGWSKKGGIYLERVVLLVRDIIVEILERDVGSAGGNIETIAGDNNTSKASPLNVTLPFGANNMPEIWLPPPDRVISPLAATTITSDTVPATVEV